MPAIRETVESALSPLGLALHDAKTRVTSIDTGIRFLGAHLQGGSILVPFEKPKSRTAPVFVAPPMPPALVRAWRAGKLACEEPFRREDRQAAPSPAQPVELTPAHRLLAALRKGLPGGAAC